MSSDDANAPRVRRRGQSRAAAPYGARFSRHWFRDVKAGLYFEDPVANILVTSLEGAPSTTKQEVDVKNVEYVASYNWMKASNATMIVPGSPPVWSEPSEALTLSPDEGYRYVDQDAFRMKANPLLPIMVAADVVGKKIDWRGIDFIGDRTSLHTLLGWIQGEVHPKYFRIDMELAGDHTILLNRWESRDKEIMSGRTYGFNFERATTTPMVQCEDSVAHLRVVRYAFCGFKMMVRFEVDACLPPASNTAKPSSIDGLANAIADLSTKETQSGTKSPSALVEVIHGGVEASQSALVELTSRSKTTMQKLNWMKLFYQLYLSGTPHLFIGIHSGGVFEQTINKHSLNDTEMTSYRKNAEEDLRKLGSLLEAMKSVVLKHGEQGRLSLVGMAGDVKIYRRKSKDSCLPAEVMKRFHVEQK